jgi:hypothetical protein
MAAEPPSGEAEQEVRPPLGTWNRLYALVLGVAVLEVALLWLLARAFA